MSALVLTTAACAGPGAREAPATRPLVEMAGSEAPALGQLLAAADAPVATAIRIDGRLRLRLASGDRAPDPAAFRLLLSRTGAFRMEVGGRSGYVMVSDGARYRVRATNGRDDEGDAWQRAAIAAGRPWMAVSAADLLEALLPPRTAVPADQGDGLVVEARGDRAWLTRLGPPTEGLRRPLRRVEVRSGKVTRRERFSAAGRLDLEVTYSTDAGGARGVRLEYPGRGLALEMALDSVVLDPPSRRDDFLLEGRPRG